VISRKRRLFRSFLKKPAPKTSVILKKTFETVSQGLGQKVVMVSRIGVIFEHRSAENRA
jgi:hypothetical protein